MPPPSGHSPDHWHASLANEPGEVERVENALVESLGRHRYPKASVFAVRLALHEAVSNGFRHGNRGLGPDATLEVEYDVTPDRVTIVVEDRGPGFDPHAVPDPTTDENLERGSGRGLLLIRAYMTSIEHNAKGNRLRMVYERPR